jgi:hypothetical protein
MRLFLFIFYLHKFKKIFCLKVSKCTHTQSVIYDFILLILRIKIIFHRFYFIDKKHFRCLGRFSIDHKWRWMNNTICMFSLEGWCFIIKSKKKYTMTYIGFFLIYSFTKSKNICFSHEFFQKLVRLVSNFLDIYIKIKTNKNENLFNMEIYSFVFFLILIIIYPVWWHFYIE